MPFDYTVKAFAVNNPRGSLVGNASIIIDDFIEIKGFKIINGKNGLFVSSPNHMVEKDGEKKYYDDVWFMENKEEGEKMGPHQAEIFSEILKAYGLAKDGNPNQSRGKTAAAQQTAAATTATPVQEEKPKKRLWKNG